MKVRTVFLISSLLVFAACGTTTPPATGENASSQSAADSTAPASESASSVDSSAQTEARVIDVSADNWSFTPATIEAKKGEKVIIRLTGVNGTHSFRADGLGITQPVNAGETVEFTLPTDAAGTFEFRCGIPCGEGHRDMVGTITISE